MGEMQGEGQRDLPGSWRNELYSFAGRATMAFLATARRLDHHWRVIRDLRTTVDRLAIHVGLPPETKRGNPTRAKGPITHLLTPGTMEMLNCCGRLRERADLVTGDFDQVTCPNYREA